MVIVNNMPNFGHTVNGESVMGGVKSIYRLEQLEVADRKVPRGSGNVTQKNVVNERIFQMTRMSGKKRPSIGGSERTKKV